jgi:hypothetical protein
METLVPIRKGTLPPSTFTWRQTWPLSKVTMNAPRLSYCTRESVETVVGPASLPGRKLVRDFAATVGFGNRTLADAGAGAVWAGTSLCW